MTFIQAFRGGGWGPAILGSLSIIFGLVLIFGNVFISGSFLVFTIAGIAVVGGIVAVIMSFQIKTSPPPPLRKGRPGRVSVSTGVERRV